MAVRNEWADTNVQAGKKGNPGNISGSKVVKSILTFAVAAADSDASIIRIAKLPAGAVITKFDLYCDAITGCTSVSAALYKENGSVLASSTVLAAAKDIAAGQAIGSPENMMADVALADLGKALFELLGLTSATKTEQAYDLALLFNTIGSGAGNVTTVLEYYVK